QVLFFFKAEDGIRDFHVTGVQTCALPILGGALGLGTGVLTLRLRGAYFAIATLCLSVVLQTIVVNWSYVGGSRGAYIIRPREVRSEERRVGKAVILRCHICP